MNDTVAPVLACPPAVSVQCDADVPLPNFAGGGVSDNCDPNPVVTHVSDVAGGSCPKVIVRTYKARDFCGNEATCTQTIIVNDTMAPVLTCPAAVSVQCDSDVPLPDFAGGSVSDNCDASPVVTHVSDVASGSFPKTIARTYKARDLCGNEVTCTQTITVNDTLPPDNP